MDKFVVTSGNCTACGACASVCPQGSITIRKQKTGFICPLLTVQLVWNAENAGAFGLLADCVLAADGIVMFLGRPYENLMTCDFLCHSVPAAGVYEKYITDLEAEYGKVTSVDFRSKAFFIT